MLLYQPGIIAETILPSITSSQLSYILLFAEDDIEDGDYPEVDNLAWGVAENHICRLAKRFSVENPGEKMEVAISRNDEFGPPVSDFMKRVNCKEFLSRLKEETTFTSLPGGTGDQ